MVHKCECGVGLWKEKQFDDQKKQWSWRYLVMFRAQVAGAD